MFVYIKAMADSISEIRKSIRAAADPLDRHLIKLSLFDNCDSREHWKDEVYSFLSRVSRVKGSHRYPKYKLIRSELATDEDILDNFIKQTKSDYHDLKCNSRSDEEIIQLVVEYHDWVASQLSTCGMVTRDQVILELHHLGIS